MKASIPDHMLAAFTSVGVDAAKLVYAIHTDFARDGDNADVYAALDMQNLYILSGAESVMRVGGAKRLAASFTVESLKTYPLADMGELVNERLLSTGRLFSKQDNGDAKLLLVFSIGFLSSVERTIKVIKNIKEGRDPLFEVVVGEEQFCPVCGSRYPEPDRKVCPKCLDKASLTRRLLGFFKDYSRKVVLIIFVMLLGTGFQILSPYVGTKLLFDDVLIEGGRYYGMIGAIVMVIFAVRALGVVLNILYSYVLAKTVPWIVYDLKLKIFEAMQRLSVGFYTSKRTGALMNRVNKDANNIYWFFVDGMPYTVVNIFLFAGVIIFMCILNIKLALVSIVVIPVTVLLFRFLMVLFKRLHHRSWVYSSLLNSLVSDSVSGQRVIKAYAREDEESERFSSASQKLTGNEIKWANTGFTAFPLIYLFMFVGQTIITVMGGMMVLDGEISLGTLLTFIAYLTMIYGPLEFMSWVSNWWARCVDAAQRVFEIIDAKPEITEPERPVILDELKGSIEARGVWFEYDPATPVLKGLDLSVDAGRMLGVVGKTGVGKSTLANLIARLYDVTEGSISIDGVNVKDLPLAELRRNVGIVSQEIYLFIGTITDNIRYARPTASIEEVILAAKAAAAHEFIMNLPDAYETRIGSGGQDLSGGEKQRLSIARTIIQNPRILILDEATAAMDTETEGRIQESLQKLRRGRTTISIAHRLSTLRDADNLAVLNEGKVVETGTHAELMAKKGEYHKLYSIQMEGLKVISMEE